MARGVNATSRKVKAKICALGERVSQKDARKRSVVELVLRIGPEPGKTKTAEDPKLEIVRFLVEQFLVWRLVLSYR